MLACTATETVESTLKADGAFTFVLEDGRRVRLYGVDSALSPDRAVLTHDLVNSSDDKASIVIIGPQDRYQRHPAQIIMNGFDMAESLLSEGLVYRLPVAPCGLMREAETHARINKLGLWQAWPLFATNTKALNAARNGFAVVAGQVTSVRVSRGRVFVNFAPLSQKALSLSIPAKERVQFTLQGLELAALSGQSILMRGVMDMTVRGPLMRLTSAHALEKLE